MPDQPPTTPSGEVVATFGTTYPEHITRVPPNATNSQPDKKVINAPPTTPASPTVSPSADASAAVGQPFGDQTNVASSRPRVNWKHIALTAVVSFTVGFAASVAANVVTPILISQNSPPERQIIVVYRICGGDQSPSPYRTPAISGVPERHV